ncbi:phage baseplate protein [Enterococcus sp. DIV1420a]|uniref:phage baseplate protein n=1 Tax=Enterococcus sp. DIV1420a TaxID=2774672 RepID=UPI003F22CD9F
MSVQFYLDIEGKRQVLPVNPGEIKLTTGSKNTVVEVIKLGDVNVLGGRSLVETSFSSFFPQNTKADYVNPKAKKQPPIQWVKLVEKAKNNTQRVRLIVTGYGINTLMVIESFEWGYVDATGDIEYTLTLKEYRNYQAKYVKTVKKRVSPRPRPNPPINKPITIGCEVICNGQLHRDSYGTGPGVTEVNAHRLVNFMAPGKPCPYHVTMLDGGWRGWVTAGSVRRL